jgi:hypothetical protein
MKDCRSLFSSYSNAHLYLSTIWLSDAILTNAHYQAMNQLTTMNANQRHSLITSLCAFYFGWVLALWHVYLLCNMSPSPRMVIVLHLLFQLCLVTGSWHRLLLLSVLLKEDFEPEAFSDWFDKKRGWDYLQLDPYTLKGLQGFSNYVRSLLTKPSGQDTFTVCMIRYCVLFKTRVDLAIGPYVLKRECLVLLQQWSEP